MRNICVNYSTVYNDTLVLKGLNCIEHDELSALLQNFLEVKSYFLVGNPNFFDKLVKQLDI